MIKHNHKSIPTFSENFYPNDKDWVYFVWDNVADDATINNSTFTIPTSITQLETYIGPLTAPNGTTYSKTTGIKIQPSSEGVFKITNTVTLSDGRVISRSVNIVVDEVV